MHAISRFSIVAKIYLIYPVFTLIEAASVALQAKHEDIGRSCDIISSLKDNLIELRDIDNENVFDASDAKATRDCQYHEIEIVLPRARQRPQRFRGNGNENGGLQPDVIIHYVDYQDQLKKTVWTPFLVSILEKLDARFTVESLALGRAISAMTVLSGPTPTNIVNDFLRKYPTILCDNIQLMFAERRLAFQDIRNIKSLHEVALLTGKCCKLLEEVFPDRVLYPNFYRARVVAATIPFTQSSCERS